MNRLGKNSLYYFGNDSTFRNDMDNTHFFVMENYSIGMHKQGFFEINIVTRGKGVHYIEENEIDAEVGDVFIIPPEIEHGYIGDKGFDVYHILINNKFVQKNLTELQMIPGFISLFSVEPMMRASTARSLHLKLAKEQFDDIFEILDKMKAYRGYTTPSNALIATGVLLIVITKLCGIYAENIENGKSSPEVSDNAFMKSIAFIHEKYHEKLEINALAEIAHLSRSTYIRKFIKVCKMPPLEYITAKRIEVAEAMLKNTSFSVVDIAFKTGFYDASHFSKVFIAKNGMSPAVYRKMNSKDYNTQNYGEKMYESTKRESLCKNKSLS